MRGKGSQTTWQRVRGNALLYVCVRERSGVCRACGAQRRCSLVLCWCLWRRRPGRSSAARVLWVSIEGQQRQLCPTIDHRSTVACICTRNSTPCLAGSTLNGSTR